MSDYPFYPEGIWQSSAKNAQAPLTLQALEHALEAGSILEAPVLLCDSALCLHVDLGCMRGYIEKEEAVWCRPGEQIKDIALLTRVGKAVCFKILGFEERDGERVARLSRKAAQEECAAHLFSVMQSGDVIQAKVTHLEPYGAFLDVGCGISALLSIDCISVSRISHPKDRLYCGMPLQVVIKSIDHTLKRIFVTLKELLGTWEENAARFRAGETVTGRIRSIESYGIFVELAPNLAGLAELRGEEVTMPRVGDLAAVFIKSILPERMKIKLVIIDSHPCTELPELPEYFIDTERTRHLSRWEYSPLRSSKLIETIFDA